MNTTPSVKNDLPRSTDRNRTSVSTKASQNPAQAASGVRRDDRGGQRTAVSPVSDSRKEVVFELDASSAKEVLLAGDFTDWEKTPIKLRKGDRGAWQASIKLPPGQYHYKFVVDGEWRDDPRATKRCPNTFGTSNSVLEIS